MDMHCAAPSSKRSVSGDAGPSPKKPKARARLATVGCIVGQHGTVKCLGSTTLTDVADLLVEGDRSAAAIVDEEGQLLGAITENDIVRAFVGGTDFNYTVTAAVWLQGGCARCPSEVTAETTVFTSTPLFKAAEIMRGHALSDHTSRHLIVRDSEGGQLRGVLSALDLARALCSSGPGMEEVDRRIGSATVGELMKPKATLASCLSSDTLQQCLATMLQAHQNCVLIEDAASHMPVGIVTPRDALRAFAEHLPLNVPVGKWLRGLQSDFSRRQVRADAFLVHAAWVLATQSLHHLIVLSAGEGAGAVAGAGEAVTGTGVGSTGSGSNDIVGVLSSTDVAQAIGSAKRVTLDWTLDEGEVQCAWPAASESQAPFKLSRVRESSRGCIPF